MSDLAILRSETSLAVTHDAGVTIRGPTLRCCVERPVRCLLYRHREQYTERGYKVLPLAFDTLVFQL